MIADLNQITSLFVKEQRADGSLIPINNEYILNNQYNTHKGIIRCALVAGKPVFGRNTPLHPNLNISSLVFGGRLAHSVGDKPHFAGLASLATGPAGASRRLVSQGRLTPGGQAPRG